MTLKKITLITDAWSPQVNGVVRTLQQVTQELVAMGHQVEVIHPGLFKTIPCPSYPEISLALFPRRKILERLESFKPQHIHIATEGPLGLAAWRICNKRGWKFTTAFHTQFPEYIQKRFFIPLAWSYALLRHFHNRGVGTMVATATVQRQLESRGFNKILPWSRGVNTQLFHPSHHLAYSFPRPVHLYVGRVAVEKNLEAFLSLDLVGSKVVVGDGPSLKSLKERYPKVHFLGLRQGASLAECFSSADVFVFPSKTDTFGLVMLEAMACGLPVAAFPVQGPLDVLTDRKAGVMHEDLNVAIQQALKLQRADALAFAQNFSWTMCAEKFINNLRPSGLSVVKMVAANHAKKCVSKVNSLEAQASGGQL